MKLINKIDKFLGEEEVFDASAGVESLRKIVSKGETGWLGWKEGKVEVSPIAANFLLKVYDMLGLEKKPAFVDKFKTKRGFMNLYLVSRGVALGESTFAEAYDGINEALSVPEQHAMKIAIKTLKMPDAMVGVMGGMDKAEARKFLFQHGWTQKKIIELEGGKWNEPPKKKDEEDDSY